MAAAARANPGAGRRCSSPPAAPAPRSAPVAEPASEETEAVAAEASRAAPAAEAPAPEPKPVRGEARPAREASPPPQKSVYDSLEQEMASLLGRPGKT